MIIPDLLRFNQTCLIDGHGALLSDKFRNIQFFLGKFSLLGEKDAKHPHDVASQGKGKIHHHLNALFPGRSWILHPGIRLNIFYDDHLVQAAQFRDDLLAGDMAFGEVFLAQAVGGIQLQLIGL